MCYLKGYRIVVAALLLGALSSCVDDSADRSAATSEPALATKSMWAWSTVNVREGRGTDHPVVRQLPVGQRVVVDSLIDGWWTISLPNGVGRVGYAAASVLHETPPAKTTAAAPRSVGSPAGGCIGVPAALQETIEQELIDVNGRFRVSAAQAVRTRDFERAHFVSVVMYAAGIEDGETLTWLVSGELNNPGMWFAADHMTDEFTYVPYAGNTQIGRVRGAHGYSQAKSCAEAVR